MQQLTTALIALLSAFFLAGCRDFAERLAVVLFYQEAPFAPIQIYKDLPYWTGPNADDRKHRLDFYVPEGRGWPVLIFVHGGGWTKGDKALKFGGVDPYGNIGRFYAARGIGVAVINYRLQSKVTWREQIKDIARALAWVHGHTEKYGANRRAIFISGHSSGAQLAARTVVDHELMRELKLSPSLLCGVISVSGAPFDIEDKITYELGTNPSRYEKPFRAGDSGDRWKHEASAAHFVTPSTPPFLLMYGRWEARGLKRQNEVMYQALTAADVPARLVVTPWDGHGLIVAALSHPDRMASAEILDFIRTTQCSSKR
jgi:acetyl esterase/lipase